MKRNPTIKKSLIVHMALVLALSAFLTGCASKTQVAFPERPVMPTENLTEDVTLDAFVAACIAEIERREGYESLLRASLNYCKTGKTGESND